VLRSWLKILVSKWQARDGGMSAEAHEGKEVPETTQPAVRAPEQDEESPKSGKPSARNTKDRGTPDSAEIMLASMYEAGGMTFLLDETPQLAGASGPSKEMTGDENSDKDSLSMGTADQQGSMIELVATSPEASAHTPPKELSMHTSPKESSTHASPKEPPTNTPPETPSADGENEGVRLSKRARKQKKKNTEYVTASLKEPTTDTSPAKPSTDGNSDKDSLSTDTSDQQGLTIEHMATSPKESSMDTSSEKPSADGENEGSLSKGTGKQKKKKKKNKKEKLSTEKETVQDALSGLSRPDHNRPISLTEGLSSNPSTTQNPPLPTALPHLTSTGTAHMVSVSAKPHTTRTATAVGVVCFTNPTPLSLIRSNALKKGDVLSVSRIAGIMAAKKCPDLIPLCHPIALTHVGIEVKAFGPDDTALVSASETVGEHGGVVVEATVQCTGPTGVEMEALTAVMGAALTVVDMCKAVDKFQRVERVRVVRKEGGKSGTWNEEGWKSCM
jgi:molybdenum cofactor biosynthesis protein MoaC